MALAILVAAGQVVRPKPELMFLGELYVDGRLRHTQCILPMVATAPTSGIKQVYVPAEGTAEAAQLDGIEVLPVRFARDVDLASAWQCHPGRSGRPQRVGDRRTVPARLSCA